MSTRRWFMGALLAVAAAPAFPVPRLGADRRVTGEMVLVREEVRRATLLEFPYFGDVLVVRSIWKRGDEVAFAMAHVDEHRWNCSMDFRGVVREEMKTMVRIHFDKQ